MGRWIRGFILAGLLLPALLVPAVPLAPSRSTEPTPATQVHGGLADLFLLAGEPVSVTSSSDAEGNALVRVRFLLVQDSFEADADGRLDTLDDVSPEVASARADDPGPSQDGQDPAPVEPIAWMGSAQMTLAALGAAVHYANAPAGVQALAAPFLVASSAMPDPSVPAYSGWLLTAIWAVFLASLGILLAPRVGGAAWALYARLAIGAVERHPRRATLLALVRERPGLHVASLRRITGIEGGVLRHHLEQLEQHGLVRRLRRGRATHWFPADVRLPAEVPASDAQRRVLLLLSERPGASTRQVAERLSVSPQNAWKHLRGLNEARRVQWERRGRSLRWALA